MKNGIFGNSERRTQQWFKMVDPPGAACYACHARGMQIEGRKASVMSHPFLSNCMQCRAPPRPKPFLDADVQVETEFVGLPAPEAGERPYPGAPPAIPHSPWMRQQCNPPTAVRTVGRAQKRLIRGVPTVRSVMLRPPSLIKAWLLTDRVCSPHWRRSPTEQVLR